MENLWLDRLKTALITGAILGVVCILGVGFRVGYRGEFLFLLAMWYNRVLMGLVIGVAYGWMTGQPLLRGLILGTLISFAFFFSTGFRDVPGFFAGGVYGVIIDWVATKGTISLNKQ